MTAWKVSGRTLSRLTLTRSIPAALSAWAVRASPSALVVIEISRSGETARVPATMSTSPRRTSGSPPVNRTSRMPSRRTPMSIRRTISVSVSTLSSGSHSRPSAGMQ